MEKDPSEIRREIEETRERMGDTVEALAYKADVPARAQDALHDRVESVKQAVSNAVDATQTAFSGAAETVGAKVDDAVTEAQPHVAGARDTIGTLRDGVRDVAASVGRKLPSRGDAQVALGGATGFVQGNPVGLAVGAIAAGFLLGSLFPASGVERDKIGPLGEKLTASAKSAASGLVDQGKAAVTAAVSDAFSGKPSKSSTNS